MEFLLLTRSLTPAGPDHCTYIGNQKLFAVIEAGNRRLALRYKVVVGDVVGQQTHLYRVTG